MIESVLNFTKMYVICVFKVSYKLCVKFKLYLLSYLLEITYFVIAIQSSKYYIPDLIMDGIAEITRALH